MESSQRKSKPEAKKPAGKPEPKGKPPFGGEPGTAGPPPPGQGPVGSPFGPPMAPGGAQHPLVAALMGGGMGGGMPPMSGAMGGPPMPMGGAGPAMAGDPDMDGDSGNPLLSALTSQMHPALGLQGGDTSGFETLGTGDPSGGMAPLLQLLALAKMGVGGEAGLGQGGGIQPGASGVPHEIPNIGHSVGLGSTGLGMGGY